jgi:hypothetical protein
VRFRASPVQHAKEMSHGLIKTDRKTNCQRGERRIFVNSGIEFHLVANFVTQRYFVNSQRTERMGPFSVKKKTYDNVGTMITTLPSKVFDSGI